MVSAPPGWDTPPGPVPPSAAPAAPVWPIVLITVPFSLFGLIPTVIASNRASQLHQPTGRYWLAFVFSLLGAFVLYALVFVLLAFVVLTGTAAVVSSALDALPSVPVPASPGTPTATSTGADGATTGPCRYTPSGTAAARPVALPDDPAHTPSADRTWTLQTTAGRIVVDLDGTDAPCTVQSLVSLTQQGYFDGTPCPRSVDDALHVLQCGDPTGTGTGGPGYTSPDEDLAGADYEAGALAMANVGPDTNGSQFFLIAQDANAVLPKAYTVFGHVTDGFDVVTAIVAAGNKGDNPAGGGTPNTPISILTATVS